VRSAYSRRVPLAWQFRKEDRHGQHQSRIGSLTGRTLTRRRAIQATVAGLAAASLAGLPAAIATAVQPTPARRGKGSQDRLETRWAFLLISPMLIGFAIFFLVALVASFILGCHPFCASL
jgi:hypothetical protein